jgi:hypothetical protein
MYDNGSINNPNTIAGVNTHSTIKTQILVSTPTAFMMLRTLVLLVLVLTRPANCLHRHAI